MGARPNAGNGEGDDDVRAGRVGAIVMANSRIENATTAREGKGKPERRRWQGCRGEGEAW